MINTKGTSKAYLEKLRRDYNTVDCFNARFDLNKGTKYKLEDSKKDEFFLQESRTQQTSQSSEFHS